MTLWHYTAFVVDSYLVWRLRKALLNNKKPDISEHNRSLPPGNSGILPAERVSNMTTKEGDANPALIQTERQEYFDRIKQAQQPDKINQAQQYLIYKPNTIANSALSAICNPKYEIKDKLPKETRLTSAQVFRNSYSIFNIRELLLGHIILQGTYTRDGLIERPLLLPFVKKKCCT